MGAYFGKLKKNKAGSTLQSKISRQEEETHAIEKEVLYYKVADILNALDNDAPVVAADAKQETATPEGPLQRLRKIQGFPSDGKNESRMKKIKSDQDGVKDSKEDKWDTCVISWRWPATGKNDEGKLADRILRMAQKVKALGYEFVFIDYLSVNQAHTPKEMAKHVSVFTTYYSTYPVVTYYPITEVLLDAKYEVTKREEERYDDGANSKEYLTRVNSRGWIELEINTMFKAAWSRGGAPVPFSHLVPEFDGSVDFPTLCHWVKSIYLNNIKMNELLTTEQEQAVKGQIMTSAEWAVFLSKLEVRVLGSDKMSNMQRNRRANLLWSLGRPGFYLTVFDDVRYLGELVPGAEEVTKAKTRFGTDERILRAWLQVYIWAFQPHEANGFDVGTVRLAAGPIGDAAIKAFTGFKKEVIDEETHKSLGTGSVEIEKTEDFVLVEYVDKVSGYLGDKLNPLSELCKSAEVFFKMLQKVKPSDLNY
eukprot:gb/GEZN01004920.1/.p1 GENE.gb/GEZN01004920.1/~~gb/GEZN01004920.1/.p1  ORF type:complete len:479 (-),score=67.26 gb/GEZN01004920.1/:241-1677(-)